MPKSAPLPPAANRLLAALPRSEYKRLLPHLTAVHLEEGATLYEPGEPIPYVYFPESGLISLLAVLEGGAMAEVGIVGRGGVVGLPVFLGNETTPFRTIVQVAGAARRVEAGAFRTVAGRARTLGALLHRYLDAFLTHVGQSAACNSYHSVEQRCCRWLLVAQDRLESSQFRLTQQFLAAMLGVRRTGVSEVAGGLQRAGLIRYRRGRMEILDREGLEAAACGCHRIMNAGFAAVFGQA